VAEATRPTRSDAVRNRDAILEAAIHELASEPHASMTDIARAAGVGRVTLYGHFSSREELVEATLLRVIERSEAELASLDLSGEPMTALDLLVRRSWRIVDTFHRLLGVAESTLSNEQIRAHHAEPMARVRSLIERGQHEGAMRRDLDAGWLTSCFTAILHTAAGELRAGRLAEDDADRVVATTVVALLSAPRA
jgi:AcrR family transcriptional regulator